MNLLLILVLIICARTRCILASMCPPHKQDSMSQGESEKMVRMLSNLLKDLIFRNCTKIWRGCVCETLFHLGVTLGGKQKKQLYGLPIALYYTTHQNTVRSNYMMSLE